MSSIVFGCESCGQTFSKIVDGAMGLFKSHLPTRKEWEELVASVKALKKQIADLKEI